MELAKNFISDLKSTNFKSGIIWSAAIGIVILLFGFGNSYPMNFATTATIFFLFILIHGYQSEIVRLKRELKNRDQIIESWLKEDMKKTQNEEYVVGTERKRTELDDALDKYILDKYYREHMGTTRTLEKDEEILKMTYLKKKV